MIIIQTTVADDNNAKELINLLLETNKIACGTFHTIQSSYTWKDEIINEPEVEVSMHTRVFTQGSCRHSKAKTSL